MATVAVQHGKLGIVVIEEQILGRCQRVHVQSQVLPKPALTRI